MFQRQSVKDIPRLRQTLCVRCGTVIGASCRPKLLDLVERLHSCSMKYRPKPMRVKLEFVA